MGVLTSINEAKEVLIYLRVHVGTLEIIDWDEIFEHVPDSDDTKGEIIEAIEGISESVKKLKQSLK